MEASIGSWYLRMILRGGALVAGYLRRRERDADDRVRAYLDGLRRAGL